MTIIRKVVAASLLLVLARARSLDRHPRTHDQIAQQAQHTTYLQKYPGPETQESSNKQQPDYHQQYYMKHHNQTERNNTLQSSYQNLHHRILHQHQDESQEVPLYQNHILQPYLHQAQSDSRYQQHQVLQQDQFVTHAQHQLPLYQLPFPYISLHHQATYPDQHHNLLYHQNVPVQQTAVHNQQQHAENYQYIPVTSMHPQTYPASMLKGIHHSSEDSSSWLHKNPMLNPYQIFHQQKIPYTQQDPVLQPYIVYNKGLYPIQGPVNIPYPLPVSRPYSLTMGRSVSYNDKNVPVFKPYPVYHQRKAPYPVVEYVMQPYLVFKKEPYPVRIPVDRPYAVHVPRPYPVVVEKKVPYTVEKQVPYEVREYIDKPYPVQVPVFKRVPYTVERKVPFKVEVPVETPVPVIVPKPYPVYVVKKVPYTLEKLLPYPIKINVPVPVDNEQSRSNTPKQDYQLQPSQPVTTTDPPKNVDIK